MRIYPVLTDTQDLGFQALLADFICERLHDAGKTAICFIQDEVAQVKTNAQPEAFKDACLEAGILIKAWLRVNQPNLSAPASVRAA